MSERDPAEPDRSQPKPEHCPSCGSERIVPVAYGFPGPGMSEDAARGKIILGGCIIREDNPAWGCRDCGRPIRAPGDDDSLDWRLED